LVMSALLLKTDIARYFPVAAAYVDPKMPPERLSERTRPKFSTKTSLLSLPEDLGG
jgi:hypothetical protein